MGGKSRKTGGVSRTLIDRLKSKGSKGGKCGSKKEKSKSKGLLDSPEK